MEPVPGWRRPALWVIGVAAVARAIYLAQVASMPYADLVLPAFDQFNYHRGALALAAGDWRAPSPNELYAPLYKYLLGIVYALAAPLTDLRVAAARAVQLGLGVWVSWQVYVIGRRFLPHAAAIGSALLYATFGQALYHEGLLLREFPACAALVAALGGATAPGAGPRLRSAFWFGIACSLRPNLLLAAPVIVWAACPPPRARRVALWGVLFGATLLPSCARNAVVLGNPAFRPEGCLPPAYLRRSLFTVEPQGPYVLAVGNYPGHRRPGWLPAEMMPPALRDYGNTTVPTTVSTVRMVAEWAADDPAAYLRLVLRKVHWTLWDGEIPDNHSYALWREHAPLLRLPWSHTGLLLAVALGAALVPSIRRAIPRLLWLLLAAVLAGVVVAYPTGRFRVPVYPVLAWIVAATVQEWISRLRSGDRRAPLLFASACAAFFGLLRVPEPDAVRVLLDMDGPNGPTRLLRPNDLTNLGIAYIRTAQGSVESLRAAEGAFVRGWNQAPPESRILGFAPGAAHATQLYPGLVPLLRAGRMLEPLVGACLRWECFMPMSAAPHAHLAQACLEASRTRADPAALAARRAAYRACLRAPAEAETYALLAACALGCASPGEAREALEAARDAMRLRDAPPGRSLDELLTGLSREVDAHPVAADDGPDRLLAWLEADASRAQEVLHALLAAGCARPEPYLRVARACGRRAGPVRELALLRAAFLDPDAWEAHRDLTGLYDAQGLGHRGALHLDRLARDGPEAERDRWARRLAWMERATLSETVPSGTPEVWREATVPGVGRVEP